MTDNSQHVLDLDLSMTQEDKGTFSIDITDNWSISFAPNGGYIMAVMASAMLRCTSRRATPIITAHYISRCSSGPAMIHVEPVFESGNFLWMQARLIQGNDEKIRAFGTFSSRANDDNVPMYETGPPVVADIDRCIQIPVMPEYTLFDHIDLRLDPEYAGWITGRPAGRSEHKGYVTFRSPRPLDIPAVLLFADTFPPCVWATQGMHTWVPTIEFSVNIRKIPETGTLKGIFRTRFISCGLVEEDGELWDADGHLVALSRQIAKYRP